MEIIDFSVGCALARGVLPAIVMFLHLSLANRAHNGFQRYLLVAMAFALLVGAELVTLLVAVGALAPAGQLFGSALWASALAWLAFASDFRRLRHAKQDIRPVGRAYLAAVAGLLLLGLAASLGAFSADADAPPGSAARHGNWAVGMNWVAALSALWLCRSVAMRGTEMVARRRLALFCVGCAGIAAGHIARNAFGPREILTAVSLGIVAFLVLRQAHIDLNSARVRAVEKGATTTLRFHRIAAQLGKSADTAEICRAMLRGLLESLDADAGGIYLLGDDGESLRPEVAYEKDFSQDVSNKDRCSVGMDDRMAEQVARTGRPLYAFGQANCGNDGVRCALAMPLRSEQAVFGVVRIVSLREDRCFTEEDVRFMSLVVDHGSLELINAKLREQEISHHRAVEQLKMARKIQNLLVPVTLPHVPGFLCHAVYRPALEVSGDYYDLYHLDDDHVGVVVADVSGKGAAAALVMTDARTYLKTLAPKYLSPRACLADLNEALRPDIERGMFITVIYAIIDLSRRTVRLACAGHTPALIARAAQRKCVAARPKGPAIGLLPPERFARLIQEEEYALGPGDTLVLYTDGVTEAKNERGESFGPDSLCDAVRRRLDKPPADILNGVLESLDKHAGGATQYDDVTIIALKAEKARKAPEEPLWSASGTEE